MGNLLSHAEVGDTVGVMLPKFRGTGAPDWTEPEGFVREPARMVVTAKTVTRLPHTEVVEIELTLQEERDEHHAYQYVQEGTEGPGGPQGEVSGGADAGRADTRPGPGEGINRKPGPQPAPQRQVARRDLTVTINTVFGPVKLGPSRG